MTAEWPVPAGLHAATAPLPVEGDLPALDGATGWLNTDPLSPEGLRGRVVLASFCTFTCINWIRQLPYVRAWAERYSGQGLVVLGVHTPEYGFEHDAGNVRRALAGMRVGYPVAIDSDYGIWRAFGNHYWPALYLADARGRIRHHRFGEGGYQQSEMVIRRLLAEARPNSGAGSGPDLVAAAVEGTGLEAPADWDSLRSPENYTGYDRTENFTSPGGVVPGQPSSYQVPERLRLNDWALAGDWTMGEQATTANAAGGRIVCRFQARDLHLVIGPAAMGPAGSGAEVRFRVRLDGEAPGPACGLDVDAQGRGVATQQRLCQLIRQPGLVAERTFELTAEDPGLQVYAFTFG